MGRTPRLARPTVATLRGASVALLSCCAIALAALGPAGPAPLDTQTQPPPPTQPQSQPEAPPERVIVFCRDGRRVEGRFIRQDPSEIVLEIAGIETAFSMSEVLRVDPVPPVSEHYRMLRAVIADDDTEQLLLLVDWLRDREAYSLALVELAHILTVDPANTDAQTLKLQVESLVQLKAEALAQRSESDPAEPREHRASPQRPEFPVLTPDQINLLKVYEVNLDDPPRMTVDRETIRDLIATHAGHELIPQSREAQAALERRPAAYILELMFRLKARDFYNRVRVEGEPEAFRRFRDEVHRPWLVNSCASTACHGGQQSGRLWLTNTSQNAERTIYTNFLILDRYRLPDGAPLINYERRPRAPAPDGPAPRGQPLPPPPRRHQPHRRLAAGHRVHRRHPLPGGGRVDQLHVPAAPGLPRHLHPPAAGRGGPRAAQRSHRGAVSQSPRPRAGLRGLC